MINMKKIKRNSVAAVIVAMCLMTAGCAGKSSDSSSSGSSTSTIGQAGQVTNSAEAEDAENSRVSITGDFTITAGEGGSVSQDGSVYTITAGGEYTVTGLLSEGQIVVDAGDDAEVSIILSGASITCSTDSPIYVINADEVKIKSEENTFNEVIDSRAEATEDTNDDAGNAAIYSTTDLKLVGKGALVVTGSYNNGVQSKDSLSIKNVTLKVTAANNAIKGNDSVEIESGNIIAISTKGDGIKTSNSSISNKGNQKGIVTITGGTIDIYAACDGIDAAYGVDISGDAIVNIYTDSYSEYSEEISASSDSTDTVASILTDMATASTDTATVSAGTATASAYSSSNASTGVTTVSYISTDSSVTNAGIFGGGSSGGRPGMPGDVNESGNSSAQSYSTKGIKAESDITISGGTITISCTDDGLHANADSGILETGEDGNGQITISGGTLTISSGDDGIHADKQLDITGGYINILTSYEGLEAAVINIDDGDVYVYATDDGLNASAGDSASSTPLINVTGGYLDVTTPSGDTDAIDSNGNYTQSGGTVLVKGGSSSGSVSGSVDVEGSITVTGGTVIALGGICETPVNSVNAYTMSSASFSSGTYTLEDSDGNEIISWTLDSSYSGGWICSDSLTTGTSYTLSNGSTTVASWTQESGTMGSSSSGMGGMGGSGNMGGGNMGGGNMGGGNMGGRR